MPSSKRDYQLIAAVIKQEITKQQRMDNSGAVQALYDVAYGVCVAFQKNEPSVQRLEVHASLRSGRPVKFRFYIHLNPGTGWVEDPTNKRYPEPSIITKLWMWIIKSGL